MKLTLKHILPAAASLLLAVSCEFTYKDLEFSNLVNVPVSFNWTASPHPENMQLYLYPKEGGAPLHFEVPSDGTSTLQVPEGLYDVVAFNSEVEYIVPQNTDSFDDLLFTTERTTLTGSSAELADPGRTVFEELRTAPDSIAFSAAEAGFSTGGQLNMNPASVINSCRYVIEHIPHLEYLRGASTIRGELFPVAGARYLVSGELAQENCAVICDGHVDWTNNTVTGTIYYFDCCKDKTSAHSFAIYFWNNGGETVVSKTFTNADSDVSRMLHNDKLLVLDGSSIELPKLKSSFDPGVNDWDDPQEEPVDM